MSKFVFPHLHLAVKIVEKIIIILLSFSVVTLSNFYVVIVVNKNSLKLKKKIVCTVDLIFLYYVKLLIFLSNEKAK